MLVQLKNLLSAPVFPDDQETRTAALLHTILLVLLAATLVGTVAFILASTENWLISVIMAVVLSLAIVGLMGLLRSGRVRLAGLILCLVLWVVITTLLYLSGRGMRGSLTVSYLLITTIAGALLGSGGIILFGLGGLLAVGGFYYAEISELMTVTMPPHVEMVDLMTWITVMGITGLFLWIAFARAAAALRLAQRRERELAVSNRELEQIRASLEERVSARTRSLAAAARVSSMVAEVLDPDELVRQVVQMVGEQFDLYYVGLFLIDRTGEWSGEPNRWVVLRAGIGEAGRLMLERGHKFMIGDLNSMIGRCVQQRQAVVALDTRRESRRYNNPLLPQTCSEMALPLISRGRIVGAMTIQSRLLDAFSRDDVTVLQTMADQIAVAWDNARSFAEAQAALSRAQDVQQRYQGQAWMAYLKSRTVSGYQQEGTRLLPLSSDLPSEAWADQMEDRTAPVLTIPLRQGDQVLGTLGFKGRDGQHTWSEREVALVQAIAEQLVLAAENQRLLDETQRRAAHDRIVGEVTAQLSATLDVDRVLQIAVQEIRQALNLAQVQVRLEAQR